MFCVCALVIYLFISKNNRSFDTPVKGPPQGPRLHIDIPRVQLLIEDKEGIKQIGEKRGRESNRESCVHVSVHARSHYLYGIYVINIWRCLTYSFSIFKPCKSITAFVK